MEINNDDFFGKHLAITHHRLFHLFTKAFQKEGFYLTFEQSILLKIINDNEGVSQQKLSILMNRDKTSITRAINILEDKNLVVRIPLKEDKRKKFIYLTKEGKKRMLEILPKFLELRQKIESALNNEELDNLQIILNKIDNKIDKIEKTL